METGGVDEWIWQGEKGRGAHSSISAKVSLEFLPEKNENGMQRVYEYSIDLGKVHSSFYVNHESIQRIGTHGWDQSLYTSFSSTGTMGELHLRSGLTNNSTNLFALNPEGPYCLS